jgi:hypothetical protein
MTPITYRVVPHKRAPAGDAEPPGDVEMTEPGGEPRIVNTFNTEAEAWDWISERRRINKLTARRVESKVRRTRADGNKTVARQIEIQPDSAPASMLGTSLN